jgi:DNA replication and repair protein RecF
VAAHLDAARRSALFEEIASLGAQAWYTGTDRAVFDPLDGRVQHVAVRAGTLERMPERSGIALAAHCETD